MRRHLRNSRLLALTVGLTFTLFWGITPVEQTQAFPEPAATQANKIILPPGFKAELLYSVPKAQGSWVSLAVDPKGRIVAGDQYGGLYRITPPALGGDPAATKVEAIKTKGNVGTAHGLLFAFDSLYLVAGHKDQGLYRLRDTNGDDTYDDVKLLRTLNGRGEHGPHSIILSPDKKSIYFCAGNHTELTKVNSSRVPRNWQEDFLLGRQWDARGHARGKLAPGGWICKVDPDGKNWELISSGYRNEFDIAFNPQGELFTFDADMEWDIGTSWYRPTRVCHATSGSEFGWRSGTGKWPVWFPDSLPPVVDIGPGSPTGIVFGTGTKFPAKYQKALFVADWSYGKLYAVHLKPEGATYSGTFETFAQAAPLPATDIVIHPKDGAMYFAIGGRRVQSGLYRITYTGKESTAPAKVEKDAGTEMRALRKKIESWQSPQKGVVEKAWPYLKHKDRFIRYAARVAIEHQPVKLWEKAAFAEEDPQALITAMVAYARCSTESAVSEVVQALDRINFSKLTEDQKLELLRAYALAFIRLDKPVGKDRDLVIEKLSPNYPATSEPLNRELCRVLVYLEAPDVASRTLELLKKAGSQEEQIHYVFCLRKLQKGWTLDQRKEYFQWFNQQALKHRGGASFGGFLNNIRNEAKATLTDAEKTELAKILNFKPPAIDPGKINRPFVKKWTTAELLPILEKGLKERDFATGQRVFGESVCYRCHRFNGTGGIIGPDLTAVSGRFSNQDLLDAIVDPSKVISDQYQATTFYTKRGQVVTGRVANLSGDTIMVMTNMLDPGNFTKINATQIEKTVPSRQSMMPQALLDTFTREEILDLIAYLKSGGNRKDPMFKQ